METDRLTSIIILYLALIGVSLILEMIVSIKQLISEKKGRTDKKEKVRKQIIFLMLFPIILAIIPSICYSVSFDMNLFMAFLGFAIWPMLPVLSMGYGTLQSIKRSSTNSQKKELSPEDRKKKKIQTIFFVIVSIIGITIGIVIGLYIS